PLGRAVGRHHQGRRLDVCDVLGDRDTLRLEGAQDGGVVDEVPEDREGAGVSVLERERDGIANAETHAEVGRSEKTHTLQFKVYYGELYIVKLTASLNASKRCGARCGCDVRGAGARCDVPGC